MNWIEILGEVKAKIIYQWKNSGTYTRTNKAKY